MILSSSLIFKNDIDIPIIIDTKEDLTTATKISIKVRKPDGTDFEWIGTLYQTTKIKYMTVDGDLDQAGTYKIQGYAEIPPARKGRTETISFKVKDYFAS